MAGKRSLWSARDGLIAATALVHNLIVLTRKLADFQVSGVNLLNPLQLR